MGAATEPSQRRTRAPRVTTAWADDDPKFDKVEFDLSPGALAPAFGGRSPKPLTERQRERLDTVLRATLRLADQGGYEAVRMRDLDDTGVALGTIYRFFGSRDFLIYYATEAWCERATIRSLPRRSSRDFKDQCLDQFVRLMAQYEAHPRIVEAQVRAITGDDPIVRDFMLNWRPETLIHTWPPMDEFEPDYAIEIRRVIERHAFGEIVRWSHGQKTLDQVRADHQLLLDLIFSSPRRKGE